MECEKCNKHTDVIKHIKIKSPKELVFKFNNDKEAMVCMECYNNKPEFYEIKLVETIRNG